MRQGAAFCLPSLNLNEYLYGRGKLIRLSTRWPQSDLAALQSLVSMVWPQRRERALRHLRALGESCLDLLLALLACQDLSLRYWARRALQAVQVGAGTGTGALVTAPVHPMTRHCSPSSSVIRVLVS